MNKLHSTCAQPSTDWPKPRLKETSRWGYMMYWYMKTDTSYRKLFTSVKDKLYIWQQHTSTLAFNTTVVSNPIGDTKQPCTIGDWLVKEQLTQEGSTTEAFSNRSIMSFMFHECKPDITTKLIVGCGVILSHFNMFKLKVLPSSVMVITSLAFILHTQTFAHKLCPAINTMSPWYHYY